MSNVKTTYFNVKRPGESNADTYAAMLASLAPPQRCSSEMIDAMLSAARAVIDRYRTTLTNGQSFAAITDSCLSVRDSLYMSDLATAVNAGQLDTQTAAFGYRDGVEEAIDSLRKFAKNAEALLIETCQDLEAERAAQKAGDA